MAHLRVDAKGGLVGLVAFSLGLGLALADGQPDWLRGWLAYGVMFVLALGLVWWVWKSSGAVMRTLSVASIAAVVRLAVGIGLMVALPVVGYQRDTPTDRAHPHEAGYFYYDAYERDHQARDLAASTAPLASAFGGKYLASDQYGGMLALSAAVYRWFSPDYHRPWLMLILNAAAASCGVLFVWAGSRRWFGEVVADRAAWVFALYPEGVLLGATHMREAYVMPALAMGLYGMALWQTGSRKGMAWLGASLALLFFFQPPVALVSLLVLGGIWLLSPGSKRSWKAAALLGVLATAALALVVSIWGNLPALRGSNPFQVIVSWLQYNFDLQAHLTERSSGMVQSLVDRLGESLTWLVVLVLGVAQPVLPATVGDPDAAGLLRFIGFWRAAGWYALAPLLVYGLIAAWRTPRENRRFQLLWLLGFCWVWVALVALNAGGDQWDNPRYRTILLAWQALTAAWAWEWARQHRDVWLGRWLAVEAFFVFSFTEWYLARYGVALPRLSIWGMIALNLAAAVSILGGGLWWDWRTRRLLRKEKEHDHSL